MLRAVEYDTICSVSILDVQLRNHISGPLKELGYRRSGRKFMKILDGLVTIQLEFCPVKGTEEWSDVQPRFILSIPSQRCWWARRPYCAEQITVDDLSLKMDVDGIWSWEPPAPAEFSSSNRIWWGRVTQWLFEDDGRAARAFVKVMRDEWGPVVDQVADMGVFLSALEQPQWPLPGRLNAGRGFAKLIITMQRDPRDESLPELARSLEGDPADPWTLYDEFMTWFEQSMNCAR